MAQVPILSPLEQVQNKPAPTGYQNDAGATPDAFGASAAQGLSATGGGLQKLGAAGLDIATQQQQEDNQRALKQADVTLADKLRVIQYGDGTADNPGYFAQRGDNAVNNAASTMAAVKQAHADVMAGITNSRVKDIFSAVGAQRVEGAQSSIGSFVDQQRLVANVGASDARQKSTINDAAAAWNDPKQLATSLAIIGNEAVAQGKLLGWSPEEVKAKGDEATAALFSNVIKAAGRTGDFATAQKILQDNIGSIPGSALPGIERELRTDQRNARVDANLAREEADRAEKKRQQEAGDKLWNSAIDANGNITVPPGFAGAAKAAGLHYQAADALVGAVERLSKHGQEIVTAPGLLNDLSTRASLPEGDPNRPTQMEIASHVGVDMSKADAEFALSRLTSGSTAASRAKTATAQDAFSEYTRKALDPSGAGTVDMAAATKDTRLTGAELDNLKTLQDRLTKQQAEVTTAPGLLNDLTTRAQLPVGDPNKTTEAEIADHVGKDLSRPDAAFLFTRVTADRTLSKAVASKASQDAFSGYASQIIDPANKGNVDVSAIANDPSLTGPQRASLWSMQQRVSQASQVVKTAPGLVTDMLKRAQLPDNDPTRATPTEVYDHAGKDMTTGDANFVLSAMKPQAIGDTKNMTDGLYLAKKTLSPGWLPGMETPAEVNKFQRFEPWYYQQLQQGKGAGKSTVNMLNPASPDFILKPEAIAPFTHVTGDDVVQPGIVSRVTDALRSLSASKSEKSADPLPPKPPVGGPRKSLDDIFGGK